MIMAIAIIGLIMFIAYGIFIGFTIANLIIGSKLNDSNNFGDVELGSNLEQNAREFGIIESACNMDIGRDHYYSDMVYNQTIIKRGHGK